SCNGRLITGYDSVKVLICTYGVDMSLGGAYQKIIAAINSNFTAYSVSTYTGNSSTGLASALSGKDVVIFPRQTSLTDGHYSTYGSVLNSFASSGGHIVFTGTSAGTGRIFSTGLFTGNYSGTSSSFNITTHL